MISVSEYFCVAPFGRLYCSLNFERLVRKSLLYIKCYLALFFEQFTYEKCVIRFGPTNRAHPKQNFAPFDCVWWTQEHKQFISLSQVWSMKQYYWVYSNGEVVISIFRSKLSIDSSIKTLFPSTQSDTEYTPDFSSYSIFQLIQILFPLEVWKFGFHSTFSFDNVTQFDCPCK